MNGGAGRRKHVVAALVRRGDRVLVSRRRFDQPMPGLWEFPGGKVEPGETPAAALAREIREELGCDVVVGPLFETVTHRYDAFDLVMDVHECALAPGAEPRAVEVAEIAWLPARDLPSLAWLPADVALAERLAALG